MEQTEQPKSFDFQKEFNSALKNRLMGIYIRFTLNQKWKEGAELALRNVSLPTMQIQPDEFQEMLKQLRAGRINCYYYAILSNNIENQSAKDLGFSISSLEVYGDLMQTVKIQAQKWNEQTEPIRKEIYDETFKQAEENQKAIEEWHKQNAEKKE